MYISVLPRGRRVDLGGSRPQKGGLGGRAKNQLLSKTPPESPGGVHLEDQNLIRGDTKIFQYMQNSDVHYVS